MIIVYNKQVEPKIITKIIFNFLYITFVYSLLIDHLGTIRTDHTVLTSHHHHQNTMPGYYLKGRCFPQVTHLLTQYLHTTHFLLPSFITSSGNTPQRIAIFMPPPPPPPPPFFFWSINELFVEGILADFICRCLRNYFRNKT